MIYKVVVIPMLILKLFISVMDYGKITTNGLMDLNELGFSTFNILSIHAVK